MSKTIILGSSNVLSTRESANTHMVFVGQQRTVLVDAPGGNTVLRLEQAGLNFRDLTDIIVTHFHTDHTLGIPQLLIDMWLLGRRRQLNIHGLQPTIDRVKALMDLYDWSTWPDCYPVTFYNLPTTELSLILDCADFTIYSSPVHHSIPNIGLRIQFKPANQILAYSCDTEPCDEVVRLSGGANILFHEATGEFAGHSSASQAGEIARKAEVGSLFLIHYATGKYASGDLLAQARAAFPGTVELAKDFMTLDFEEEK